MRLLTTPCTWQCAGSGTPLAECAPAGLNFASVICVGPTGKVFRAASFSQAAAGSDTSAAIAADAPSATAEAVIRR